MRFAVHRPGYQPRALRAGGGELPDGTDISGGVKRRFLPGLKAGVSTPRSS